MGRLISGLRTALLGRDTHHETASCPAMRVTVKCAKCGEAISVRVDKANDLLAEYDDTSDADEPVAPSGYVLRKEMVGRKCQNLVHFTMRFDGRRRIVGHEIQGGQFVDWEDTD